MQAAQLIEEPSSSGRALQYATKCVLRHKFEDTMGIQVIPIEIALHIATHLDPEDLFHWALSCRQFGYLIRDNAVCRASLRTRPYSRECQGASVSLCYSKALRIHVKRRAAMQLARPFSVAVLESGDAFIYANGTLCYSLGRSQVRFLDFNEPSIGAWSFDLRQLLGTRLAQIKEHHRHKFKPLHFADGLFSCLYSTKTEHLAMPTHWLTVINVKSREIVNVCELDRIEDIWVRNNRDWLYCGISAETEDEDTRSWVLFQFDVRRAQWASKRVMIQTMPHGDLGIGNCFEIFDGYLYGASSRMPVNLDSDESQAWNSFYYVFRFPLGDSDSVEVMEKKASWRRWPADGNVDDRWGSLQLVKDEVGGEIYLYESRREFLESRPQSQRNCYRKKVVFAPRQPGEPSSWVSSQPADWEINGYRVDFPPEDIHHGDDWYRDTTYKVREAPIRTYIPTCRTFLDVIAQVQDCNAERPPLHIRSRPRDPSFDSPRVPVSSLPLDGELMEQEPKADHGVNIWPSKREMLLQDPQMITFLHMLYPDTTQELSWHADERFIVYTVAPVSGTMTRHLVIFSFDPSVRLPGAERWAATEATCQSGNSGTETNGIGGLPDGGQKDCTSDDMSWES